MGATRLAFAGATYNAARDKVRLTGQTLRIFQFMRGGGEWFTLREIEAGTSDPQASISARLRAFKQMTDHRVEKRLRSGSSGTWEYRLHVNASHLPGEDKRAA
jgi:hypothetical protein